MGCSGLTAIAVDPPNAFYSSVDGVLVNNVQAALIQYPGGKTGGYTTPTGVTSLGSDAFNGCTGLTSITIANSVTNIGESAFGNCSNLTSVTLSTNLPSIAAHTFLYCTSLASVTIPNSVTAIGSFGFYGCSALTSVTIPSGVNAIESCAFYGCSSLTSVTIPSSVSSMAGDAFVWCQLLQSVYFEGNAPGSGGSAFYNDTNATIYYLPGTVGWSGTFGGRPTAQWRLPYPLILSSPSFGVQTNAFGFVVSWATNLSVVVEGCANLASSTWTPLRTNALSNGWFYFSDADWTNYPARLYRIRSP